MTTLVIPGTSQAFVAQGRWVARCGYPHRCSAAVDLAPFQGGFICPDCRGATEVIWESPALVEGIGRLLLMRPHPNNRNWLPGETLVDLMVENGHHGIYDATAGELTVSDGRIMRDTLPGTELLPNTDRPALPTTN